MELKWRFQTNKKETLIVNEADKLKNINEDGKTMSTDCDRQNKEIQEQKKNTAEWGEMLWIIFIWTAGARPPNIRQLSGDRDGKTEIDLHIGKDFICTRDYSTNQFLCDMLHKNYFSYKQNDLLQANDYFSEWMLKVLYRKCDFEVEKNPRKTAVTYKTRLWRRVHHGETKEHSPLLSPLCSRNRNYSNHQVPV